MFLTKTEIHDLTGYKQRAAQLRWLRDHGYRHTVNGLGNPVVAIAEFNRHMVGGRTSKQEPNFEALLHG